MNAFAKDIQNSELFNSTFEDINNYVDTYNKVLRSVLDKHAPSVSKTVTIHPRAPWYDDEVDLAKKERRSAEHKWRTSKLTVHREIFMLKKDRVNQLLREKKKNHYNNIISESNDQKALFSVLHKLCNVGEKNSNLPSHSSSKELANRFAAFFQEKIIKIRSSFDSHNAKAQDTIEYEEPVPTFTEFKPATEAEIRKTINGSKCTSCNLDPIPTSVLKSILDTLLPVITSIVNMSFDLAHFPDDFKLAIIIPLLKKLGLDLEVLKHFRPVSNLAFISKTQERIAASRLTQHMILNNLCEIFQSSYKKFHSTETALLKVQSDILSALDQNKCVLLVLLDLSAAFDTIDHDILLNRLNSYLGISGKALKWFSTYLKGRKQAVLINDTLSDTLDLQFGVPQGSVLGPLMFIIYMSPLGRTLRSLDISYHCYADDTQLYVTFGVQQSSAAVSKIEVAVRTIKSWMTNNFLCLNDDKTEVLLISSKLNQLKLNVPQINICGTNIIPAPEVRNLGFIFDSVLDCKSQINKVCKIGWLQLRNIGKIRSYLDEKSTKSLIHAFITSRLDIYNSLYLGLPDVQLQRLQILQNAAARMVLRLPKYSHITEILYGLHWLPVKARIKFKTLLFVFKCLHNEAPLYIKELLKFKPNSVRSARSNDQNLLVVPRFRTKTYGDRNFKNIAPIMWNSLPTDLRLCTNINTFKKELKTFLFEEFYRVDF